MKLVYIVGGAIAVLAFLGVGLFVAQGPQPEIIVPAEKLFSLGPLNVTNTLLTSWVVIAILAIVTFMATRSMSLMPSGMQNFFEAVISFLVGQVEEIAGEKNGRKFFMVVATIFIYVIVSNWFGLLPFFNAVGKTEDVGHEIFHELSAPEPEHLVLADDHTYSEGHKFAGWKMDESGGIVLAKSGAKAVDFEVLAGETPGAALDRYIVFLARNFGDFKIEEEAVEHPTAQQVTDAFAALENNQKAPKFTKADAAHGESGSDEAHALESPTLHQAFSGVSFEESQKMALVIPFFRGTFSDINKDRKSVV